MIKRLKDLISSKDNLSISGPKEVDISGISEDSRSVKQGEIFVAVKGIKNDGHDYISAVLKNGIKIIAGEKKKEELKLSDNVTYIQTPDSRQFLGVIASRFYGNPSTKLKVIGVTGTDGKTTTAHFVYWFLVNSGKTTGLVSTVSAIIGGKEVDTGLHVTSPDSVSLQKFLHQMVLEGCEYAVVEVTSHGIDQQRIAGVEFDTAILTKITNEHLDYHKTFAKYRDTKLSLLKMAKNVIINKDDQSYSYLLGKLNKSQNIISYSREKEADIFASEIHDTREGISFYLNINNNVDYIRLPIAGIYNVSNLLAAFAVINYYNIPFKKAIQSLQSFKLPTGRMEKIETNRDFDVIVDFAHNPDALKEILTCLKEKSRGRLICIFGCAGERDKVKRPKMGEIASGLSDIVILTAEDPRSENVNVIIKQIRKGIPKDFKDLFVFPDRKEAIRFAIMNSKAGDTVGIFGKGHEKSMNLDGKTETPWSDQEVVSEILNEIKSKKR